MSWNDGYERRKFDIKQKKQAEEYRALGMTESQIKEMYEFDLEQYKNERCYRMHTQQFTSSDFDEGEEDDSESTMFDKFFDELTFTIETSGEHTQYWWIEEIDNPRLVERLQMLSNDDLELLTQSVMNAYSQTELAEIYGIAQKNISKKLKRIKNFLAEGV